MHDIRLVKALIEERHRQAARSRLITLEKRCADGS
jgi:hypothetical protein